MHTPHQYISRKNGAVICEQLLADRTIGVLYHHLREHAPTLFKVFTSGRMSSLLGFLHFDLTLPLPAQQGLNLLKRMGISLEECLDPPESFTTARQVFERKIRYWHCRPMDEEPGAVVSPADAKLLIGSLARNPVLPVKETVFTSAELLGPTSWASFFSQGDFALCRLTPDKYHYNHVPVAGRVVDIYTIDGQYHSCNPNAQIALASLHAKNRRVATIIDTNVPQGSQIGLVAMIEVVALMIGDICQCYSEQAYDNPQIIQRGMFLKKGQPKSLYRPGSSTDIILFEPHAIDFCQDLKQNLVRQDVQSRFSEAAGYPQVETDVTVRSTIAYAQPSMTSCSPLVPGNIHYA